jgi:carbon-monoxide dehydrogenase catalytic subunit
MALVEDSWVDKKLVEKAKKDNAKLVFDRFEEQQPQCNFGLTGVCCKNCFQGPCRIIPGKQEQGICGVNADVIVARNLLRTATAGATCHTDHAKEAVLALLKIAEGKTDAYEIKDEAKLRNFAKALGKKSTGSIKAVAKEVALEVLEDYRRQQGLFQKEEGCCLNWLKIRATKERIETWKKLGILPVNSDSETSHALHQTTMGNDADPVDLLLSTLKMGLVDGYGGLNLATDMQDIIFGTPYLTKSEANLGVLKEDYVNIIVHGHVPLLSEKVVEWAKKLTNKAKKLGAKGINIVGMCCTGNELLMRQGIPFAGHVMQQELAIVTGIVDATVVDLQCIYPSLQDIASCYHTKLITTIDFVKIPGALHIKFDVENADNAAKQIIDEALKAYPNRKKDKVYLPKEKTIVYAGFSVEAIIEALSKLNKEEPLKPLVDNIKSGNILGVVGIVGCRNPKLRGLKFHEELTKILLKNNILVVGTGCWAHAAAQEGLMTPEATEKYAGPKLKEVLKVIGKANGLSALPPALHMGSCVDNGRIGTLLGAVADYMKVPISKLPVAGSAPEYVTEKAVAIGTYFLTLGIAVHLNPIPPVTGSPLVTKVLTQDLESITGGKVLIGTTPEAAAKVIIEHIKIKRKELGIEIKD